MPSVAIIGTRGYPSYYGGFETAVRVLAPYLAEHGWDVTVYGRRGATKPSDPTRDPRVSSVETGGIESRSLSTLSYGATAALSAARRRPDVALVMNVANGFFLPLLHARGIPTLVNVDGIEWDRQKWGRIAKAMFRTGARMTARWGDELVMDAKAINTRWVSEFGRGGLFIPYGGHETGELPLEPGLSHRGYVLIVARFVPENTVPEFLEAVPLIAESRDVVIVGSSGYGGELDDRVRALAAGHSRVRWLGHVADDTRLHSLWQHAGAYFHGHSVGGTNPALVQAMRCGAPIVARDTVFNREVLADAGRFVGTTPSEIAQAIEAVIASDAEKEKLSRRGLERARSDYAWEAICERYASALTDLLPPPTPAGIT